MKVLLTGAAGQLGQALVAACPPGVTLIPCSRSGGPGEMALDLADSQACRSVVLEQRPDAVLNAGAYTAVDRAEQEPALAQAVNAEAPAAFAEALATTGGQLLQLSTDFVFNGRQGSPYRPEQTRDPLGVYGASKAAIIGLTKAVAADHVGQGVRCNAILPGLMHTPMIDFLAEEYAKNEKDHNQAYDKMIAIRNRASPTGKMGTGWDTANAALFLASDEAAYVNGHLLVVDGGITVRA